MNTKQDLKSLTRGELINWFKKYNIEGYRAKQVFNWIYKNNVSRFREMVNLPVVLINELENISYITNLKLQKKLSAEDGTTKFLWKLADGHTVESVYIPYPEEKRYSVCISTQVGCAMGCKFCATALMGLSRNLKSCEIVDQVLKIAKNINKNITNIVFMGMGEPLANIDNLFQAIKILNDKQGLNIGARKMTVSTAGIVPGIKKLIDWNIQINLAVSLNAPSDKLRDRIMPVNKKYPLSELIAAVREYINKTNRRVTFEYVLIKDINDSPRYAKQLCELLQGLLCHINLIPVNKIADLSIDRPSRSTVRQFQEILLNNGLNVTVRKEKGSKIQAACGQLRYTEEKGGVG